MVFSSQEPNGSVSFKMQCYFGTKSQNISPRKCQWITFILLWIYSFGQNVLQHDLTFWIVSFPPRLHICKFYVPWNYFQPPLLSRQVLLRSVSALVSLCKGTSLGWELPQAAHGAVAKGNSWDSLSAARQDQARVSCSQNSCASLLCNSDPLISPQGFAFPHIYTYLGPRPGSSCSCQ